MVTDFFEEDEPIEDIKAAWAAGSKDRTESMTQPEEDKARSAGVRQADRLLGMDTAQIVAATKASREIQSTYRVFSLDPVIIGRYETEAEAQQVFATKYEGRVRDWSIDAPGTFSKKYTLTVELWTVSAEFKHKELADAYRLRLAENGADPEKVQVVARNSRAEHVLAQYGVLKIGV